MIQSCDPNFDHWQNLQKQEAFVAACWAFKRRNRITEPTATEFGIPWSLAETLARQVQKEFETGVLNKGKAA